MSAKTLLSHPPSPAHKVSAAHPYIILLVSARWEGLKSAKKGRTIYMLNWLTNGRPTFCIKELHINLTNLSIYGAISK